MASSRIGGGNGALLEVAFVCTANRARSPLAEALLGSRVDPRQVKVSSFGTLDLPGWPALADAVAVGLSLGIDLSGHRSRALQRGDLRDADLVVGFEQSHLSAAVQTGGADSSRAFMILGLPELLENRRPSSYLSGVERARWEIAEMHRRREAGKDSFAALRDPSGQPRRVFAETARVIDAITVLLASELFTSTSADAGWSGPFADSGSR